MKQYEDNGTSAPKIAANSTDKKEKDLERRVRTLADQVVAQQQLIDRMHRDIIRYVHQSTRYRQGLSNDTVE